MARIVLSVVSTLSRTGPVEVLKGIVQQFDLRDFRPVIVTLSHEGKQTCIDDFEAKKIEIVKLSLTRIGSMTRGAARLKDLVRAIGADIVHSHCFRADVLASRTTLSACRVSTIHSVLADDYGCAYGKAIGTAMTRYHYRALRNLDARVSVSVAAANAAAQYGVRSQVIINGVDTDRFHPPASPEEYVDVRERLRVPAGKVVILYSGRLIPRKRPVEIIRSFVRGRVGRIAHLVLAGDGPLYNQCIDAAANADNVLILGSCSDLPDLLRGTDYLISASISEGLPMALLEACASGVRLIASDISPHRQIRELFPDRVTLFPIDEPEGLSHALESLTGASTDTTMTHDSVEQISARTMSKRYQELYNRLLSTSAT